MKPIILYSMKSALAPLLFISFISIMAGSCRRPDQAGPNDSWCTSGISIQVINDNNVPAGIKNMIYRAPPQYVSIDSPGYNSRMPVIIIPFQFAVSAPWNTMVGPGLIRDAFFSTGTGSVKDYFAENSYGQYNIQEGFIANLVTLPQDSIFYASTEPDRDWTRSGIIQRDICQLSNVNWASFDMNGDRLITHNEAQICFMVSAGAYGAKRSNNITVSTQTGSYTIQADFVFFDCKKNSDPTKGTDDIRYNYSTIWHEMSHAMFHLPDRYVGTTCATGRTGNYDLMSANCSWKHMSMYDKMKIGWLQPRVLVKPSQRADQQRHCYTFPNSENTPAALVLWDNNQPNEYWIVENRYKGGSARNFDRDLPESGLAIWWVDENTHTISLVDARDLTVRPSSISYSSADAQMGVLFKNRTGRTDETFNMQFLRSGTGSTEFAIRAVSPEGETMRAEF